MGRRLTYAGRDGHAFIDRALYLPRCWTEDAERRTAAGVPAEVGFATKPALARQMVTGALDAGVPAGWVAADEVYGADTALRVELERRGVGYVLAVARDDRVPTKAGPQRADALSLRLPRRAWQPVSAGAGAKGQRIYDWALIDIPRRRRIRAAVAADPHRPLVLRSSNARCSARRAAARRRRGDRPARRARAWVRRETPHRPVTNDWAIFAAYPPR